MLKVRIFVKQLSKMFLPDHIVYIDYNEKTVTVRGCQHSDCDTCHDEYDWEQCEIMRFTDILDNSELRKEIFEGDIVKMAKDVYSEPTYYEVVRHRGGAYRLETKQHGCELWLRHTDCEVVGNVYENKEFLEDKE